MEKYVCRNFSYAIMLFKDHINNNHINNNRKLCLMSDTTHNTACQENHKIKHCIVCVVVKIA